MKVSIALAILLGFCLVSTADAEWIGLWGFTWEESAGSPIVDVYVTAKSHAGDSPTVQSYYTNPPANDTTQYDIEDLVYLREYYRVEGETDDYYGVGAGFTWYNVTLQRDIILYPKPKK
jgi:hypothetical protein